MSAGHGRVAGALDFARAVLEKAERDQIFFMANSISFAVLVAVLPLLLLLAGVGGIVAASYLRPDPTTALIEQIIAWVPTLGGDVNLRAILRESIAPILDDRAGLTLLGGALLIWFSSRLAGTVRTVLVQVFEIEDCHGIVRGKVWDVQVIAIGVVLLLGNIGITAGVFAVRDLGIGAAGLGGDAEIWIASGVARIVTFLSIWVLLTAIYRYLAGVRVEWRIAIVAATLTAVLHEILKSGFGWYVSSVADFRTPYGNLISLAVLFFWIHYTSISFILGGEVAWTWVQRRQRLEGC
ncbi:MAG: YihY/virulence factor BrkB family protein [Longimicrobiales bacterium]|nr:YihY/virulence factor BrkB family protein [Longimicrobiales bacterium]